MQPRLADARNRYRKQKKRKKRRRILFCVLALLLIGGTCLGFYEYNKLKPEHYFKNLEPVASPSGGQNQKNSGGDEQDKFSDYKEKAGTFNVLLIGSDARKGDSASHSDSMILIHADLNDHTYDMLSIPRDTRVHMQGYGYTKLTNVQYISQAENGTKQGVTDAVKAVSDLTSVPINYYAEVNFRGLQDMVDELGGIEMTLPFKVTLTHPWYPENKGKTFEPGTHTVDGKTVAELTHERYSLPGTDYGRQQLHQAALTGIAKKAAQPSNVTRLPALSRSLSKVLIATNMSTEDMISIGLGVKDHFKPDEQLRYRRVEGQSVNMYDDVLDANNSQIILNKNELKETVNKYFMN